MELRNGRTFAVEEATLREAATMLDALANLNYLICLGADDAHQVRRYGDECRDILKRAGTLVHGILHPRTGLSQTEEAAD